MAAQLPSPRGTLRSIAAWRLVRRVLHLARGGISGVLTIRHSSNGQYADGEARSGRHARALRARVERGPWSVDRGAWSVERGGGTATPPLHMRLELFDPFARHAIGERLHSSDLSGTTLKSTHARDFGRTSDPAESIAIFRIDTAH